MNSKRIAYFINQYPKVSHSFIRREIIALEKQGLSVARIALRGWDGELVDEEDIQERKRTVYVLKEGIPGLLGSFFIVFMTSPFAFIKTLILALQLSKNADRPWPYHLIYLAEACRVLRWLRKMDVSHIHAHFGTNSTEVVMLSKALGGPSYSFTVHGPEEFDKPAFIKLGEKVKHSAFVVAISSFGRSQLFRWVEYHAWSKIKVVHCGLEKSFYDIPLTPVPERPRLVCVGRLCEQKGQLLLVQAAKQIHEKGIDFELVLAGDGEMRPEIERMIKEFKLTEKIRITGWISSNQVREEILESRAMVLASFAEGLPVVIMEAMALRRPVITTYIAGIPELVIHHENGWLIPAGCIDSLSVAMEEAILASPLRLGEMGMAAYDRVLENHSIDKEAGKLAGLFNEVFE